jgi:hypothetical protein
LGWKRMGRRKRKGRRVGRKEEEGEYNVGYNII